MAVLLTEGGGGVRRQFIGMALGFFQYSFYSQYTIDVSYIMYL